jgi:hypothetical protein
MNIVLIKWRDSHSNGGGWTAPDEFSKECEDLICETVGYEIARKNGYISIASSLSGHTQNYIATSCKPTISIPECSIISRKILRRIVTV